MVSRTVFRFPLFFCILHRILFLRQWQYTQRTDTSLTCSRSTKLVHPQTYIERNVYKATEVKRKCRLVEPGNGRQLLLRLSLSYSFLLVLLVFLQTKLQTISYWQLLPLKYSLFLSFRWWIFYLFWFFFFHGIFFPFMSVDIL